MVSITTCGYCTVFLCWSVDLLVYVVSGENYLPFLIFIMGLSLVDAMGLPGGFILPFLDIW